MTPIFSSFQFKAVTPSDSAVLSYTQGTEVFRPKAFYIGSDGDVSLVNSAGTAVTFVGVVAGTTLAVSSEKVRSTGTTASNIVALY